MIIALSDDASQQATALKILVEMLISTKKTADALSHIYEEREVSISCTNLCILTPFYNIQPTITPRSGKRKSST